MTNGQSNTATRIIERLQNYLHIASGPNEDGTHSAFVVVDFDGADESFDADSAPQGTIALLPFDITNEEEPVELTTTDDEESAILAAEDVLGSILDLIETIITEELEGN